MIPTCPHPERRLYPLTRYDSVAHHWTPRRYCAQCCGVGQVDEPQGLAYAHHREKPMIWKANGR